jgi:pyruvate formate lyase activating enzyme
MVSAEHVDPIEKKPLALFYPGSRIYSIGGWGCNFSCKFCQNWSISQQVSNTEPFLSPDEVVERAIKSGGIGIAYTYNEPIISFEFIRDCGLIAHKRNLKNVLVSNGFINKEAAGELLPLVDAINIDIKSIDDKFYIEQCCGRLQPVLDFARQAYQGGTHVEITNLLIPGLNDRDELIEELAGWIAQNLGKDVALHLSAYYPRFKLKVPATAPQKILHACELAHQVLDNVYPGNI